MDQAPKDRPVALDADLLVAALGCTRERAEMFAPHLDAACARYAIDTPARLAAFLAQIGHESGALRYTAELWGPTPAQTRYEGRADLGNLQPGDGYRYKGRGLIQTTGRANYVRLRDRLRAAGVECPDFEAEPEALEQPQWAALSAADYWGMRGLNALADAGDFESITRRINGGLNGQADRLRRWEKAKAVLMFTTQPAETGAPGAITTKDGLPMLPFIAAALPSILQAVPKLIEMFGSGSDVAERNAKAAETVVAIAKEAVGARNEQELVETLAADPQAAATVKAAVESRWLDIVEAGGGGIAGARAADIQAVEKMGGFWRSPSFAATLILAPLVYMIVGSIAGLWGYTAWSDDVRAAIATAVVSLVVGGVAGFYWGSKTGSAKTP
jgi:putative chitinase